jgi:hypothetical protein
LIEALGKGFVKMIDYSFNEGFINVRSILRKANKFEINNELAQIHVDYFKNHESNFPLFSKMYYGLIDLLQLSNFLEIFDYIEGTQVYEFILEDPKFVSLYVTSLEMQKYVFTRELLSIAEGQPEIIAILKKDPYKNYVAEILRGNYGDDFSKPTIAFLK